MNAKMDWERLMMDALDGAISARDRAALEGYFNQHPEERVLFERMQHVDAVLFAAPAAKVPTRFSKQVMSAVMNAAPQVTSSPAHQPLKTLQALFLIGVSCLSVVVVGLITLAIWTLFSPTFPQGEFQTVLILARSMADVGVDIAQTILLFSRAVFSQPIAWVISFGSVAILAIWLWVMATVFKPGLRVAAL